MGTKIYDYYIECYGCGRRGQPGGPELATLMWNDPRVRCDCVVIDRFGYAIRDTETICFVQGVAVQGLVTAKVDYDGGIPSNTMRWNPLPVGEHAIWRSGWTLRVAAVPCGFRGFASLSVCRFVPVKAFRRLKLIVRLLGLTQRTCVRESPLRFCGGREIMRLSQTSSGLKGVAIGIPACSSPDMLTALFGRLERCGVIHIAPTVCFRVVRQPPSYHHCHLRMCS